MNSLQRRLLPAVLSLSVLLMAGTILPAAAASEPGANVRCYDTGSAFDDRISASDRSTWNLVPAELFIQEKDPPKASSDPGYYGRDYSFKGDAVVENRMLAAVFWSSKGRVVLYAKGDDSHSNGNLGTRLLEFNPRFPGAGQTTISHLEVLRNVNDEVALKVTFASVGSPDVSGILLFDKSGIVEIRPADRMNNIRLACALDYGVVPSFLGDDLTYGGPETASTNAVSVPCENLFLGLLPGEGHELVMTWPSGKQRMTLRSSDHASGKTQFDSIDFDTDGHSFYLAALAAPGIWHKETLTPDFLEKDVASQWERPFAAKWKTQLYEEDLKTTFAFRGTKGDIWRGVPGSYQYPVWFDGDRTFYHFSKKVAPKGESIVYCVEGRDTPPSVQVPVDVLKASLGRQACEAILDIEGRKLRTHHRRGGDGVHRACTCGCTEAIQAVFESGEEVDQKNYIRHALDDMIYFVHRHVERINEYQKFSDESSKWLDAKRNSSPALKPFLDELGEILGQISQECEVQKPNMKNFDYADDLARQTMVLTEKKDPNNVKTYMELLKSWRAMGGAQDYVLAKCHNIVRKLYQEAGYGCASRPEAVPVAEEIRTRCRKCLRNPDGYEIWADY